MPVKDSPTLTRIGDTGIFLFSENGFSFLLASIIMNEAAVEINVELINI
jgi:hypothetical protein